MFYFPYSAVDINSGYEKFGWLTTGLKIWDIFVALFYNDMSFSLLDIIFKPNDILTFNAYIKDNTCKDLEKFKYGEQQIIIILLLLYYYNIIVHPPF